MAVQKKRYSVDDVWEMSHRPENEGKRLALIEGRLIEMSPPGGTHGRWAIKWGRLVGDFVDENELGEVTTETGYHPPNDPQTLLAPDVAFISKNRAPIPFPDGYVPVMPDLAIEIVSPNDSLKEVRDKAATYLKNGTRLVWIFLPKERGVDVCRAVEGNRIDIEFVGADGQLDGEDVLPGFTLKVGEIFPQ